MASEHIGRNDPCWCGSGQKFKKCHLGRDQQPRAMRGQIDDAVRERWRVKTCLHPNAAPGVCGKIIDAHTVQRSAALRAIVDQDNKVLTFYPIRPDALGRVFPRTVGWRHASTFTGFCSVHDTVFQPVERKDFIATPEQCFLLSYRAICFELYQKSGSERSNPVVARLIDKGFSLTEQRRAQSILKAMHAGVARGREDAEVVKCLMDGQLLNQDYSRWRWFAFEFAGELSIATCGAISPNVSLSGESLQTLHDLKARVQWLTVNLVSRPGGGTLILGHPLDALGPRRFVDDLIALSDERLLNIIPQLVFAYIENTYFAASWWNNLTREQQSVVARHAANTNAYYNVPQYGEVAVAPWILVERRLVQVD